jgi:hypothetical protein
MLCPAITMLDLEDNLLSSWEQVASISNQLELTELRLSNNKLDPDTWCSEAEADNLPRWQPSIFRPAMFGTSLSQLTTMMLNNVPNAWLRVSP